MDKISKDLIKKNEKGSITLFVIVVMLFFIIFAAGVYAFNTNKLSTQMKDIAKIQEEYDSDENIDEIYDETIDRLDQSTEIILKYKGTSEIYNVGTWTNKDLTAEILIADGEDPKEYTVKVGNTTYDYEDIAENGVDIYDNCEIVIYKDGEIKNSTNINRIDKVKPDITFYPNREQIFPALKDQNTEISIILTVTDDSSGIASIEYGWTTDPNGIPTELSKVDKEINGQKITGEFGKGSYYLYVKAVDKAGNERISYSDKISVANDEEKPIIVDVTAKKEDDTEYNSGEWTNQTVTIHVEATDNGGIDHYEIFKDGEWKELEPNPDGTLDIVCDEDISQEIIIKAVDPSGNESNEEKITVNVDKQKPTIALEKETEEIIKEQEITINVTEEGSGVSQDSKYEWQIGPSKDEVPTGQWNTYEPGKSQTVGTGLTGTYYIWIREIKDNAGNASEEQGTKVEEYHVFGPFEFANKEPTATFTPDGNTTYSKTQQTKVDLVTYGNTQVVDAKYQWTQNNKQPTKESFEGAKDFISGEEIPKNDGTGNNWYLWVYVVDSAGNEAIIGSKPFYLDNTEPNKEAPSLIATNNTITVTFKQTDNNSGIDESTIQYAIRKKGDTQWSEWVSDATTHVFENLEENSTYEVKTRVKDKVGIGYTESNISEIECVLNTEAKYKVEHYQQNVSGSGYTLVDTEEGIGTAGDSITPAVKTYTGFKSPSTQTVVIAGDDSTVVKYYYTRNSYTLSLSKNSYVSSVSGSGTFKYGQSVTINATVSSGTTGYTYSWSNWTKSNGSVFSSTRNYTFTMPAENLTLTANATRKANTYTVRYDANGGSGYMASSTHTYGVSKQLTANAFTRTNYTFEEWNTEEDGSGVPYSDRESVKNLTTVNGGTVILYAQWEYTPPADTTPPTISATGGNLLWTSTVRAEEQNNEYGANRTLKVTYSDSGSGVNTLTYAVISIDRLGVSGSSKEISTQPTSSQVSSGTTGSVNVSGTSSYTMNYSDAIDGYIFFRVTDKAGNVSSWSKGQRLKIVVPTVTEYAGMNESNSQKPVILYDAGMSYEDAGSSAYSSTTWKNYGVGKKSGSSYSSSAYDATTYSGNTKKNLRYNDGYHGMNLYDGSNGNIRTNYTYRRANNTSSLNQLTYEIVARPDVVDSNGHALFSSARDTEQTSYTRLDGAQLGMASGSGFRLTHRYYYGTNSNPTFTSLITTHSVSNLKSLAGQKRYSVQSTFTTKGTAKGMVKVNDISSSSSNRTTSTGKSTDQNMYWATDTTWLGLGAALSADNTVSSVPQYFIGMMYGFRYYERILTEDELQKNAAIDYGKYNIMVPLRGW